MSDGINEAWRGTYFTDRSKLIQPKKLSLYKKIANKIKEKWDSLNRQLGE